MQSNNNSNGNNFLMDVIVIISTVIFAIIGGFTGRRYFIFLAVFAGIIWLVIYAILFNIEFKKLSIPISILLVVCVVGNIFWKYLPANPPPIDVEAVGDLKIKLSEIILKGTDDNGQKTLAREISDEIIVNSVSLEYYDYNYEVSECEVAQDTLIVHDLPKGTCDIKIYFKNYSKITQTVALRENELNNGSWNIDAYVEKDIEYKDFTLKLIDRNGNPFSGNICSVYYDNMTDGIEDVVIKEDGGIPYKFHAITGGKLKIVMKGSNKNYTKEILIDQLNENETVYFEEILSEKSRLEEEARKEAEEKEAKKRKLQIEAAEAAEREAKKQSARNVAIKGSRRYRYL